ncbi:unnamed protein product, partial [Staurois parvus]
PDACTRPEACTRPDALHDELIQLNDLLGQLTRCPLLIQMIRYLIRCPLSCQLTQSPLS